MKLARKNPAKLAVRSDEQEAVESSALPAELKPGTRRVGVSKGLTVNLGDYNSARVAFWMERVVPDTDEDFVSAVVEMSQLIEDAIQEEVEELKK